MPEVVIEDRALQKIVSRAAPGAQLVGTRTFRGGLETITVELRLDGRPPLVARVYVRDDQRDGIAASRYWAAISALSSSDLPVPRPVYLDERGTLLGVPVLVITRLPGEPSPPPANRAKWIDELATWLSRIHAFDVSRISPTFRRSESAVDHAARVVRRHEAAMSILLAREVAATLVREAPGVVLAGPTLIHGDYWFGNTLWADGGGPRPRLTGILDWSAARIGNAAFDIAAIRMDLSLVLGDDAADEFAARYAWRQPLVAHQSFWDLIVGISGLALAAEWVPTYHALGWTHLTLDDVRTRLERFVRAALASA